MPERLEVGRLALRTFKVHGGRLHSVIAHGSGQHWMNGECRARCVVFEDQAFASDAEWKQRQLHATSDLALAKLEARTDTVHNHADLQKFREVIAQVQEKLQAIMSHQAPDPDCRCGIYGSLNLENLRRQYSEALFMVAVIASEGKTIIGTRGLRTEFARVVAFWTPWYQFYMRKTASRECPDAKSYGSLDQMLKDYGIPKKADDKVEPIENASAWWTA